MSSSAQNPPSRRPFLPLLGVLLVAAVALGVFWASRKEPAVVDGPPPPANEEARRFLELKNLGLGRLENEQYAESDRAFSELLQELPDEPLGARNLAISSLPSPESSHPPFVTIDASIPLLKAYSIRSLAIFSSLKNPKVGSPPSIPIFRKPRS